MGESTKDITANQDPRQVIWLSMYDVYYDSFYNEIAANALINRWQWIDDVTKVVVAVTASGSAIAGWSLWSKPGYQAIWVSLAGVAALLSIVHASLSVSDRLKNAGDLKRAFAALENEVQTCRQQMRVAPDFPIKEFADQLWVFRKRLGDIEQRINNDIMRTRRLELAAQDKLDRIIEAEKQSYGN